MASKSLSQIEREYFSRKIGGSTSQEPLNQLKRRYWISYLSPTTPKTFAELESEWQDKFIDDNGGTQEEKYSFGAWAEMVILIGLIPTKSYNDNKRLFYLNAP
jgi:hypothetical protein